ncbi:MAG: GNAT family N-acetyltransferase [Eubacteriales bacterium]
MYLTYEGADAADIEPICRFCKELIDRYEKLQNIDYDAVLAWERKKVEDNLKDYQRVLCNGKKVGYFRFCRVDNKMEIDDLYIFPCFRGQGIGTEIIRKCCSETTLPVFLYVFIQNVSAVALYKRLGFRIVQSIKDSRYIMQRD